MKRRVPDISKIKRFIGWQPEVSLDELLKKVIAYERENSPTVNTIGDKERVTSDE